MTKYYNELNTIIILHAISNAAEADYDANPQSEAAEKAFDETYLAEWNAVEKLANALATELGGAKAARRAIWKYIDSHAKAFRNNKDQFESAAFAEEKEAVSEIANRYYVADPDAVYIRQGTEYTLGVDSFADGLVCFVGFCGERLFVPACNLCTFLPGVASEGLEIAKKAI